MVYYCLGSTLITQFSNFLAYHFETIVYSCGDCLLLLLLFTMLTTAYTENIVHCFVTIL